MLIISLDAVGERGFDRLADLPAFAAFLRQAETFRRVKTLFVSNTYPVHVSVATGETPSEHGIRSNTEPFPSPHPVWNADESSIKVKTVWQKAYERGIESAAVFWPVTANSLYIWHNIPEVMARPGKSQIMTSLRAGSVLLQLKMLLRHRKLLGLRNGVSQPGLDRFAAACMSDILREYKPGLALVHLSAYDTICHTDGLDGAQTDEAFGYLDACLKKILEAAGDETDVIIFSDHGQIGAGAAIDPNTLLAGEGLLHPENGAYRIGGYGCFFECCGGSGFFHRGSLSHEETLKWRGRIGEGEGFRRYLTEEEMDVSGYGDTAFGFCAREGYYYEAFSDGKKANHGYPLDTPDYEVFYSVRGSGYKPGGVTNGGILLDIAAIAEKSLGVGE